MLYCIDLLALFLVILLTPHLAVKIWWKVTFSVYTMILLSASITWLLVSRGGF